MIAAIVIAAAAAFYPATSFLLAFSGGRYRTLSVVNAGACAVVLRTLAVSAAAWRLTGRWTAVKWTSVTTALTWMIAGLAVWVVSFHLGA